MNNEGTPTGSYANFFEFDGDQRPEALQLDGRGPYDNFWFGWYDTNTSVFDDVLRENWRTNNYVAVTLVVENNEAIIYQGDSAVTQTFDTDNLDQFSAGNKFRIDAPYSWIVDDFRFYGRPLSQGEVDALNKMSLSKNDVYLED